MTQQAIVLRDPTKEEIAEMADRFASQLPSFKPEAWRALSAADRNLAAKLCIAGFQPFHFTVMGYKTRDGGMTASLYLNLQGRAFNAQMAMRDTYGGVQVRPMTDDEHRLWKLEEAEVGAVATLYKVNPTTGARFIYMEDIGRAGGTRDATSNPIARSNPQEQALARARARVLMNGAPLGVPIGTFLREGDVMVDQPPAVALAEPEPDDIEWPEVDEDTGEVTSPRQKRAVPASSPLVVEVRDRLAHEQMGRADAKLLTYEDRKGDAAVLGMLRDGYAPHEVVDAIKAARGVQQPFEKTA